MAVAALPELVADAAVEVAAEVVVEPMVAVEPMVVVEPEIAVELVPEIEVASDEAPIRVTKVGGKWMMLLGDDRSESYPTQKKAIARANALAKKLGRTVVVG